MSKDFYCALKDDVGSYLIFSSIKLTRVKPQVPKQEQYYGNDSKGNSGGGFLRDVSGITLGVAVGNKLSQFRKRSDGKVDL